MTGFFQGKRSHAQLVCAWLNARTTEGFSPEAAAGFYQDAEI
ncbi:TPA: hypothetical protein ACIYQ6_004804 [Escherichia coli]|nr:MULTISPECIES: hypothetical protein [Enterobacteriaceae]MDR5969748.1 hypothetical protein [Escherichia coli]MDR6042539.1 hypothetical protein [Escherichia coli]MDR6057124.1 hypothetical protein [Escherichia coli]